MGNVCVNLRRRKRLRQEELDFRRRMEERIQQSSKRLKKTMAAEPPTASDFGKLRKSKNKLDKPNVTPLRLNSEGIFVEVDQQFIDEQLHLNYLRELDRQRLINNRSLSSQLPNQPNSFYQQLSRLNQLRLLQSGAPRMSALNAFDNGSFVNTSIDSGLYDQHMLSDLSVQDPGLVVNQLAAGRNGQLHPSLSPINYNPEVMPEVMRPRSPLQQFSSNLILNSTDLNQRDYLGGPSLGQQLPVSACTNVLDAAANRIFSELEYMDNGYLGSRYGELNPTNSWCGYLPLDGFMQLNKSKSFNLTANRPPSQLNLSQLQTGDRPPVALRQSGQLNVDFNSHQPAGQGSVNNLNKTDSFNSSSYPKSQYSVCLETLDSPNHLKRRAPSSNDSGLPPTTSSSSSLSHNLSFNQSNSTRGDEPASHSSSNLSNREEANDCRPIKEEAEETRNYLTLNNTALLIEPKNELNDSGNSSGTGCTDKQMSRAESNENHQINSQIQTEPWFFPHINSRTAAEHVLRMKGNRVGAFLVRHAQKAKFTPNAPYVLSLKVIELSPDHKLPHQQHLQQQHPQQQHQHLHQLDRSWPSVDRHHHLPTSSTSSSTNSEPPIKTAKDILHYKIYSHSACSNCDLITYYVNPATQFGTIRQLIAFYSTNENSGLPIRLEKPCLPFDSQNCCCSANGSLSSNIAGKANCEICNELMLTTKNRRSTGNLSSIGTPPQPNYAQSATSSWDSTKALFGTYIEHNPNAFVKLAKDELKGSAPAQLLSKSLNSVRVSSVDRISNNGIPVNASNRILTDILFNSQANQAAGRTRFSSLDDVGQSGNHLSKGLVSRLSLKDRFRNRSITSINYSDGAPHHTLTSSGSSLSRKSSDSRKSAGVRSCSLIGGQKYRLTSSASFKENAYMSADNLKRRRSSSIRLKPGSSGKYQLRKVNSCIVNNGSSLKNSNP